MSNAGTNLPGLDSEACSSKRDTIQSGYHNPLRQRGERRYQMSTVQSRYPLDLQNSDRHQVPSCEDKAWNGRTNQKEVIYRDPRQDRPKVYVAEMGYKLDK